LAPWQRPTTAGPRAPGAGAAGCGWAPGAPRAPPPPRGAPAPGTTRPGGGPRAPWPGPAGAGPAPPRARPPGPPARARRGRGRRAREGWAWCLCHAMRQNARGGFLSPRQWCALAEAWLLAEGGGPPPLLHAGRAAAECLRQADQLFGLGAKWFGPGAAVELG